MPKGNKWEVDGVVLQNLPSAFFNIKITDPNFPENMIVRGKISGKMRLHYIRIIPGDRVRIELDSSDLQGVGRITFRYKDNFDSPRPS